MMISKPSLSFMRAVPLPTVWAVVAPLMVERFIVMELSMKSKKLSSLRMVSSAWVSTLRTLDLIGWIEVLTARVHEDAR